MMKKDFNVKHLNKEEQVELLHELIKVYCENEMFVYVEEVLRNIANYTHIILPYVPTLSECNVFTDEIREQLINCFMESIDHMGFSGYYFARRISEVANVEFDEQEAYLAQMIHPIQGVVYSEMMFMSSAFDIDEVVRKRAYYRALEHYDKVLIKMTVADLKNIIDESKVSYPLNKNLNAAVNEEAAKLQVNSDEIKEDNKPLKSSL